MRCLSLMQPWATLVLLGAKPYETRSWRTDFRGRIAIHASRQFPEAMRSLCLMEPFRSVLLRAGFTKSADLTCGAILGTVELVDCLPAQQVLATMPRDAPERVFGNYRSGRWVWRLAKPVLLAKPILYIGRLGLFKVADFDGEKRA